MATTTLAHDETDTRVDEARSVRPYRWTRKAYERAVDVGVLGPGDRVQLIEGEIVEMAPQKEPHAFAILMAQTALSRAFGRRYHVRPQMPVALGTSSEPEPDLSVVRGRPRDYLHRHPGAPGTVVLALEVADTTLSHDRHRKASMYAKEGIDDYWIVNLRDRQLEVYRDPSPSADAPYGFGFQTRNVVPADGEIAPLAAPDKPVKVAALLP
jgi:Uma2 family endonuclease